jgi:hypothetical protein
MSLLSIADIRDIVVIVYGVIGVVFFFAAIVVLLVIGFSFRGLIKMLKEMLDDSVKPTLESIKDAAETVRGTTEFVGKTTVTPIARTYGAFAGLRKGLASLSSLTGHKGR